MAAGARTRGGCRALFILVVRAVGLPPGDRLYTGQAAVAAMSSDPDVRNNTGSGSVGPSLPIKRRAP